MFLPEIYLSIIALEYSWWAKKKKNGYFKHNIPVSVTELAL